jgi:serine/threonine protein kinase
MLFSPLSDGRLGISFLMNAKEHPPGVNSESPASAEESWHSDSAQLQPGTIIGGSYCVRSFIGSGGMSDIYMCDDQSLSRIVALKVMRAAGITTDQLLMRFQTEGQAIAKLKHKNIIEVYGLYSDRGLPFLVIEYISGMPLSVLLEKEGRLPAPRAVKIAALICEGLECAHDAGIIHRDLKPSNIMIVNAGTPQEEVKILDFGIAKIRESGSKLTRTGDVLGTPAYMSPEQAQGKACDALSDQYSLGCIAYEMLAGKRPFQAESKLATLIAHTQAMPERLNKVDQQIPLHVAETVEKMLRKDPAARFNNISDARQALLGMIKPQLACASRLKIAVCASTLVALIGGAAATINLTAKHTHEPERANDSAPSEAASTDEKLTDADIAFRQWCKQNPKATKFVCDKYPQMQGRLSDQALIGCAQSVPAMKDIGLPACSGITSDGLRNLVELPLSHLDLDKTDMRNEPLKVLLSFDRLSDLDLGNTDVGDETCVTLAKMPKLEILNLSACPITEKGLEQVAKIRNLRCLTLSGCQKISGAISKLRSTPVSYLCLNCVKLNSQDIETMRNMPKLQSIALEKCPVTDADLLRLADNHHLTWINLKKCPLIDEQTVLKFAAINGAQEIVISDTAKIEGNLLDRKGQQTTTIRRPSR